MKLKPMLLKNECPAWISHDEKTGYILYVRKSKTIYHLDIYFNNDIVYSTLEDKVRFIDLETVYQFAELWVKDNKKGVPS